MPNRIIKESINTSPTINALSVQSERHWYRLLLLADDHGCFEATPAIVRGKCYALQLCSISVEDVQSWQNELGQAGILRYWEHEMRIYGVFVTFDKHNTRYSVTEDGKSTRHRRKTPIPPDSKDLCQSLPTLATTSMSLPNPNPNPNPNHNPTKRSQHSSSADACELAELLKTLILKNKPDRKLSSTWQSKTEDQIDKLIRLDKKSPEKIKKIIRWCQDDTEPTGNSNFCWAPNILSGGTLRKQFDTLEDRMKLATEPKNDSSRGW